MDTLDLDAFIANIEQSAPDDEYDGTKHRCQECDAILEDVEGNFICPNCSAQATDILQLEETELHYNDAGIAIVGQRVMNTERRKKHSIDYGWAWSTDEAVVHILILQLAALRDIGLVPDYFVLGVKNMWLKFWVHNIAPYIKDEYNESELSPISIESALKLRDVEVLVKLKDKILIPNNGTRRQPVCWPRKMIGAIFRKVPPDDNQPDDSFVCELGAKERASGNASSDDVIIRSMLLENETQRRKVTTRNLNTDSISILTLNRTLAFIEAASRCLELPEPIFASDIIRACNQRLIPFYGVHKTLPDGMNLNHWDRLMFQKTRPPTPIQLTRTASLLVHKIYEDQFPFSAPIPNLETILERFLTDMNLPTDLIKHFVMYPLDFSCFAQTRAHKLCNRAKGVYQFPQYDRWAFAILLFHLKRLFVLDKEALDEQVQAANSEPNVDHVFIFHDWAHQISMRLHLIANYDPYGFFHPMVDMRNLQITPQLYNYVETLIGDRILANTRSNPKKMANDETYRIELAEFLKREIPRPSELDREMPDEKNLERPVHLRYPIQDAFMRTRRFWISKIGHDPKVHELLYKDFTSQRVLMPNTSRKWTIYDGGALDDSHHGRGRKRWDYGEISPIWPYCFKLLLSIGGYLCYCEPKELLREYRLVEEFMYPHLKILKKTGNLCSN